MARATEESRTDTAPVLRPGRVLLVCALILLLALLLRVRHAGERKSLWRDEAQHVALVLESDSPAALLDKLAEEGHPPLPYLVDYALARPWGADAAAWRRLPVFFGTLTVLLLFWLARSAFGPRCGLLAALLAATSPFYIYYSAELRAYALFGLMTLLHGLAALRFQRRPGFLSACVWGASAAALVYTHYYAFYVIAAGGLVILFHDRSRAQLARIASAAGVALLLLLPWLPTFFAQLSADLQPWYLPETKPVNLLLPWFLPLGKWGGLVLFGGVIATIRGGGPAAKTPERARTLRLLLAMGFGAVVLAWIGQFHKGPFVHRYLIGMTLLLLPCACAGWAGMFRRGGAEAGRRLKIAGGLLLLALLLQQTDPYRWLRRDVSAAATIAARIEEHGRAGDVIWISPAFFAPSFVFHYRGPLPQFAPPYRGRVTHVSWVDLPRREQDPDLLAGFFRELEEQLRAGRRVWFVLDGSFPLDRDEVYETRRTSSARLLRQEYQIHTRLLRVLYRHAEDVYLWDGPIRDYHEDMTVVLFDPAGKR